MVKNIDSHVTLPSDSFMEYYLHKDGQQCGPYDEAAIRSMLTAQQIFPADLIWNEQMPNWATVESIFPAPTPGPIPIPTPAPVVATTPVAPVVQTTAARAEQPKIKPKPKMSGQSGQWWPAPIHNSRPSSFFETRRDTWI